MASVSAAAFLSLLLTIDVITALFCGWVFHFVFIITVSNAKEWKSTTTFTRANSNSDVLCPCLFRHLSTAEFTQRITLTCVGSFLLVAVNEVVSTIVFMTTCHGDCVAKNGVPATMRWFNVGFVTFLMAGVSLMNVAHFERLRLTFSSTIHRLPRYAPKVLYAVIAVAIVLWALIYLFIYVNPLLAAVCFLIYAFCHFGFVGILIALFFKKTVAVAKSHRNDIELLDTAVRVTVSVTLSLISSMVVNTMFAILLVICPRCVLLRLVRHSMLVFDMCLNAFCLMCTFRRAEGYYKRVFGGLHSLLLMRVWLKDIVYYTDVEIVQAVYRPPVLVSATTE